MESNTYVQEVSNLCRQRCLNAGMDDYVSKPLNVERLRAVLASLSPDASRPALAASGSAESFDYANALATSDAWVIETIGQDFLNECPLQMKQLADAIQSEDHATLKRTSHTLRGLVGNFNASRIEALTLALEPQGQEVDMATARLVFSQLETEIGLLNTALAVVLAQSRTV